MKGMKSAQEFPQAAPPGKYPARLVAVDATFSKKNESMLKITSEIIAPPQFAGQQATDYVGTDGTTKFGAGSKGRLRGLLGAQAVAVDDETPDAIIAQHLLNRTFDVEFGNEPMTTESVKGSGNWDTPLTYVDTASGLTITRQKLTVKNYHPVQLQQTAPSGPTGGYPQQQLQQAPQAQAPQGFVAPGGYPQQAAPGFAPAPQFAAPQAQIAPQGFNVAAPQFAPQPQAQQFAQPPFQQQAPVQQQLAAAPPAQGFAPPQGQTPWGQPPNGAAPAPQAAPAKRTLKIEDVPPAQG